MGVVQQIPVTTLEMRIEKQNLRVYIYLEDSSTRYQEEGNKGWLPEQTKAKPVFWTSTYPANLEDTMKEAHQYVMRIITKALRYSPRWYRLGYIHTWYPWHIQYINSLQPSVLQATIVRLETQLASAHNDLNELYGGDYTDTHNDIEADDNTERRDYERLSNAHEAKRELYKLQEAKELVETTCKKADIELGKYKSRSAKAEGQVRIYKTKSIVLKSMPRQWLPSWRPLNDPRTSWDNRIVISRIRLKA